MRFYGLILQRSPPFVPAPACTYPAQPSRVGPAPSGNSPVWPHAQPLVLQDVLSPAPTQSIAHASCCEEK